MANNTGHKAIKKNVQNLYEMFKPYYFDFLQFYLDHAIFVIIAIQLSQYNHLFYYPYISLNEFIEFWKVNTAKNLTKNDNIYHVSIIIAMSKIKSSHA